MKKNIKKILNPNDTFIILSILNISISLFYLIYFKKFGTPLSYVLYLLMTYSLIVISIKTYKIIKKKIDKIIDNNKYLKKYKNDDKLKYRITLIISLIVNIIYALFKLLFGIYYKSLWFISFAFYYFLLVYLKSNIINEELKHNVSLEKEYIKYRYIAIIILFINVFLTMIILIIVNEKIFIIYPSFLAITVAVYTFYLIFISIYNLIKYRKYKSPLVSSSKIINVITSLVSLISLEIILIPTYGNDINLYEIMIMSTGTGIAIIIFIISLYMIIKSTEWLNNNKKA